MFRNLYIVSGLMAIIAFNTINAQDSSVAKTFYKNIFGYNSVELLDSALTYSSDTLTVQSAIIIGLLNNPQLKAQGMEISMFEAAALQAGLYPNPDIAVELENFLGSGSFGGFKSSENTFSIAQNFILGGKLSKGKKIEMFNADLAAWDLEKERLNLIAAVRKSFIIISSLQHQNMLNRQMLRLSEEFIENLDRRMKAGKVSPAEISRASLISTSLEIEIQNTELQRLTEIQNLKYLLGKPDLKFQTVGNICCVEYDISDFDELKQSMLNNPDLVQYKTLMKKEKANIEFEKSKVVPDISLSLGYRRINETNDNVMVLGASLPIPIFNQNEGNIQQAEIKADQTNQLYRNQLLILQAKLQQIVNNISSLEQMINKLETESIPSAKEAFEIIQQGNLVGRFTVLDVLDSQRSLFELESQYVSAVAQYNQNVIELESLTLTKFNYKNRTRIDYNE